MLDNGLVGLDASHHIVGLDGEDFLQHIRRAVGFESPYFHFAETLSAELRLAAERLLGDEAVGAGASGVNLVVDEVMQFEHVHIADGDGVLERLARSAVVETDLAVHFALAVDYAAVGEELLDVLLVRAVEDGSRHFPAEHIRHETEVNLEPSARKGISSLGSTREMTPLLP